MKRLILNIVLLSFLAIGVSSCHHKDLIFDAKNTLEVQVVFDWRNAPEANPESMALYLFETSGKDPMRFVFTGREGGKIILPYGEYDALCLNNDNIDWAEIHNSSMMETFEILSQEENAFDINALLPDTYKSTGQDNKEKMLKTPGMLWAVKGDRFRLRQTDTGLKTVTLYPEEVICHYTVDIYDIENLKYNSETTIFGSISGMAEGVTPGTHSNSDNNVTHPFTFTISDDKTSLHAEFLTFGICPHNTCENDLRIHALLSDGTAWTYTYNVTDQTHGAPDPKHVHIVLRGLPIPHPIYNGGGLKPEVDNWIVEHINLTM